MCLETFIAVVHRAGASSKPRIPLVFLSQIVTTGRLLRPQNPICWSTICCSILSLSYYPIRVCVGGGGGESLTPLECPPPLSTSNQKSIQVFTQSS